jgi:hypothetical protein
VETNPETIDMLRKCLGLRTLIVTVAALTFASCGGGLHDSEAERAKQQAELQRQKAEDAQQRAEEDRKRAEEDRKRADDERKRADDERKHVEESRSNWQFVSWITALTAVVSFVVGVAIGSRAREHAKPRRE